MDQAKCFTCLEGKQPMAVLLQMICNLQAVIQQLITTIPAPATGPTVEDLVYAASIDIDLDGADYQRLTLAGDIDFNGSLNRPAVGFAKSVAVVITADGSDRTITYNASWTSIGAAPASIVAGKTGVLSITALGPAETDVLIVYQEEP